MGITGELVRSVFSKGRSVPRHDIHGYQVTSNGSEKRKWSISVRSYLCGDEHSSVLAAEDSASFRNSTVAEAEAEVETEEEEETEFASFRSNVATNKSTGTREISAEEDTASLKSSEATVNQPLQAESNTKDENRKEKQNSTYKLFQQEDAALTIQSAFRNFMARRVRDMAKIWDDEEKSAVATPSRESIGTSVEVQTGNSCDILSIKGEIDDTRHVIRRRSGSQVAKIQEDWDDSTVSSVISKMRAQSRLEAATRRERALAYAFSQQLRMCSKKQNSSGNGISGDMANMGWSWLERWMAARQPEKSLIEESTRPLVRERAAMEERESCGSNEVSSLFEVCNLPVSLPKNVPRPANNKINVKSQCKRSFSRQNSASRSHLSPKQSKDVKEKRKRQKQPGNKRDVKNETGQ